MKSPNNRMHSDSKKRRSSFLVALPFAAGDAKRLLASITPICREIQLKWLVLVLILMPGWVTAYSTGKTTEPSEIPGYISALRSGDEENRIDAAYKLGLVWPREEAGLAVAALIFALKDPAEQVRIHAASALGELRAEAAIDSLISATEDSSNDVATFAAQSLGQIGPSSSRAVTHLWALLERKSCSLQRTPSRIALGRIQRGQERAVPLMMRDLSHSNKYVRLEAARALGIIGPPSAQAAPTLRAALHDPSWTVGQEACRALRAIGNPDAVAALQEYKEDCTEIIIRMDKD